ncbi:aminotransferase class IV [Ruficoccus amylovorans]|uniref:Aminotransferase class IV n=1 Tax=Ruficoccus amylovorans TaxID=1804625 RepID=A0A842HI35_9BACT|nr:aminotransferase class IV [Ruficoccus amylovorans]MBC2596072.1 aminotransferase class IV [Ruficoccus amylovorans]
MLIFRGELREAHEAHIPADDHGLLYGAGAFETFRTWGGRCFLLERHRERLWRTLEPLCIENTDTLLVADLPRLERAVAELLAASGGGDAVLRYTVSAGSAGFGLPAGPYREPWDMLTLRPLPPAPPPEGIRLRLLETRRDSGEQRPRGKSLAWLNSLFAWRELQANGEPGEQGLMLDVRGSICEGVTCNIFWIQDGALCTPSLDTGLLAGVHRGHLLELAQGAGVEVREGEWPLSVLEQAQAVGVINAATGPVSVREILGLDGKPLWRRNAVAPAAFSRMVELYHASLPQ